MIPEEFEDELRMALRREAAPTDFAGAVLRKAGRKRRYLSWAVAAGVALGAAIPAGMYEQRRERAAKAEEARREVMVALNITRAKLRHTQQVVQRRINRI